MIWLVKHLVGLFIHPKKEWENIKSEKKTRSIIFLVANILLILGTSIIASAITGNLVKGTGSFVESTKMLIISALLLLLIAIIIAFILFVFSRFFGGAETFFDGIKVISYSLTPYSLSMMLHSIWPFKAVEIILLVYTLILIWLGIDVILSCPKNRKPFVFLLTATCGCLGMIIFLMLISYVFN